uniref:START domain-containing protein n=1 Tax=Caenorhabditis japonica TaxID=281687 RepID=A0A8R1EEU1_CAEJA
MLTKNERRNEYKYKSYAANHHFVGSAARRASKNVIIGAHLHIAGARFRPNPKNPESTLTDVVMLADLKGFLPKLIVNQVIGRVMLMDTVTNRKHFTEMKAKRDKMN